MVLPPLLQLLFPKKGEGWPDFSNDGYTPPSTRGSARELTEEEQLALALNALINTTLEEHAAQVVSLLFDSALGTLSIH